MASTVISNPVIRRLHSSEYYRYAQHLKSLDSDSRYMRFACGMSDAGIDQLCQTVVDNPQDHVLFGVENDDLELVAVGHVAILGNEMELAFSVLPQYQNMGIGSSLIKRCVNFCKCNGLLTGTMTCLSHNQRIKRLCHKLDIVMETAEGETTAKISLHPPSVFDAAQEVGSINTSLIDYFGKRINFFWRNLSNLA